MYPEASWQEEALTFDSWRGQPYPGYQHPWVFLDMDVPAERRDLMIRNVVNFWYDSQQWYYQKFGVLGSGASAYVWDRWDAPSGSKVNDFTMYHFGDQTAWSGYQPRAFFSAVRLYAGLHDRGLAIPEKLSTYISHWIDFLFTYQQENTYRSPTDFPMDKPPSLCRDRGYARNFMRSLRPFTFISNRVPRLRSLYLI